jgi:hypothetical protein
MTTITQSIPSLGSPPLTTDPANFDTRADTLYGTSLPAVITATNTWSGQANTVAGEVNTNATNAATNATTSATARTAAEAAQAAAEAASNASGWVSGQAYLAGAVVWSPISYFSYRANANTSGTTDPSLSASWTLIGDGGIRSGTDPNEVPQNQHLGSLSYYDRLPAISFASVAPTVASAASITISAPVTFVSGTTNVVDILAPGLTATGGAQITLIPTGLWATTAAGNIALATTAVVSKALTLTYDSATAKWYPSY